MEFQQCRHGKARREPGFFSNRSIRLNIIVIFIPAAGFATVAIWRLDVSGCGCRVPENGGSVALGRLKVLDHPIISICHIAELIARVGTALKHILKYQSC